MIVSGCNHQNGNSDESQNESVSDEREVVSVIPTTSSVPEAGSKTAGPSVTPAKNQIEREDAPVAYVDANYFKEKVKNIIYYKGGKKYTIPPDTEQGKQIILMVKMRYVNTGEHVLRENKLKKRCITIQKKGKALEIKFVKPCYKIYTGGRSNDYKKVSMTYQSWFYPLEGEEAQYFLPLPHKECTYEKLGDAKQLSEYLEQCIE